jgi:hypothetical protein
MLGDRVERLQATIRHSRPLERDPSYAAKIIARSAR